MTIYCSLFGNRAPGWQTTAKQTRVEALCIRADRLLLRGWSIAGCLGAGADLLPLVQQLCEILVGLPQQPGSVPAGLQMGGA